ncbi:MAG: bifunctional transcriptional activator/DNA repair enzyme protein Ada [Legionellales bacterium]|nr:bifunctional transcriptional activator/DNA repair enzyme protein Ada [Legionellales bacterium]
MNNLSHQKKLEFYQALVNKNSQYEGVFFVGVKTTGIFCHATCPAKKPKFENCEFFISAQDALLASYRPCQRCKPLLLPDAASPIIQQLMTEVEKSPEKRWTDADFDALGIDSSTVRRQFKKRFGMTFVAYARARRMGFAMKQVRAGEKVIDTQLAVGYESSSGFREAFSRIMGSAPAKKNQIQILKTTWIDTPLGAMVAIASEHALFLLAFVDTRGLARDVERLRVRLKAAIVPGDNAILQQIKNELSDYFLGEKLTFNVPIEIIGTEFQQKVWRMLQTIPVGKTWSYSTLAIAVGQPTACRAVANANGRNQLALIIPCHRVINVNGQIGGYAGGIARKAWLLAHEEKYLLE